MSSLLLVLLLQTNSRVNSGKHHSPPPPSIFLFIRLIFVFKKTKKNEIQEVGGRKTLTTVYTNTDTWSKPVTSQIQIGFHRHRVMHFYKKYLLIIEI